MIYVLAGTQLATLLAFCFIISWVIDDKNNTNSVLAQQRILSEERLERLITKQMEDSHVHGLAMEKMFETMSEKAFVEREQLLNRIQAPEMAIAATPSVNVGSTSVVDDEPVEELELPEEEEEVGDRIPYDELLVRPKQPVPPMDPFLSEEPDEESEG